MADQSLLAIFKENAKLKAHAAEAKRSLPKQSGFNDKDYSGPDGDVIVYLSHTYSGLNKEHGYPQCILEFRVLEGEYAAERLIKYYGFTDNEYGTAQSVMDQFFEDIQRLGVDTADRTDAEIEADLKQLETSKTPQKLNVRRKNDRLRVYIRGVATEGATDYTYNEPVTNPDDDDNDDWDSDLGETSAPEASLSDWINFTVFHKPARAKSEIEFTVIAVDDAAQTLDLQVVNGTKTVKGVSVDNVRFPE
jgi:hypothetical protein